MGAWEDFLKWLADQIEQAKNLQDEEAKKLRAQAAATGDPDRVLATNLRLAARDEIYTTYGGKDSQVAKDFRVVAEEVDRLPPAEQIKFWNNLLYNVYQFNVTPGPVGPNNVVKTMLARMAGDARGRKGAYKSADELWNKRGVPGYSLGSDQQSQASRVEGAVSKGVPAWAAKLALNAGVIFEALGNIWENTNKPLLLGSVTLLGGAIGYLVLVGTGSAAQLIVIASGAGGAASQNQAIIVRVVQKGEKLADLFDELKYNTFSDRVEYALVKLADGTNAIVRGGQSQIRFAVGEIKVLFAHTHPEGAGPTPEDRAALEQLRQTFSYLIEHGIITKFRP
jgi:hypothetical protein